VQRLEVIKQVPKASLGHGNSGTSGDGQPLSFNGGGGWQSLVPFEECMACDWGSWYLFLTSLSKIHQIRISLHPNMSLRLIDFI
jgi:hypothetical protein